MTSHPSLRFDVRPHMQEGSWASNWARIRCPKRKTFCGIRHLLEQYDLAAQIFATVSALLEQHRLLLTAGTIVDATIIAAPSSTKNTTRVLTTVALANLDLLQHEITAGIVRNAPNVAQHARNRRSSKLDITCAQLPQAFLLAINKSKCKCYSAHTEFAGPRRSAKALWTA